MKDGKYRESVGMTAIKKLFFFFLLTNYSDGEKDEHFQSFFRFNTPSLQLFAH